MKLIANSKIYNEFRFEKESDFENEVAVHSELFFGKNSIYIDAKRKIETKSLGNSIPDGFLFDLSEKNNPEFYLVEVELARHSFFSHIFPQVTKFFGFYKNTKSQHDLIEKLFSIITKDNNLKKEFKKAIGEKEIYKFLKDTIEKSQNILIIIDGDKKELPEIMETYSDTWGKVVKFIVVKKFIQADEVIYTMNPDFEGLEFAEIENELEDDAEKSGESIAYTEDYHLEGVSEMVKQIYSTIKSELLKENPTIIFNPQKFYISIRSGKNIAFFLIKRKKIALVVLSSEAATKEQIHYHYVKALTPGVQRFWNGPSCKIMIEKTEHLNEIINLLNELIAKYSQDKNIIEEAIAELVE